MSQVLITTPMVTQPLTSHRLPPNRIPGALSNSSMMELPSDAEWALHPRCRMIPTSSNFHRVQPTHHRPILLINATAQTPTRHLHHRRHEHCCPLPCQRILQLNLHPTKIFHSLLTPVITLVDIPFDKRLIIETSVKVVFGYTPRDSQI